MLLAMPVMSQHAFGIVCPKCRENHSRVLSKRLGRGYIRRRHECVACPKHPRWTTYEFFCLRPGAIAIPTRIISQRYI